MLRMILAGTYDISSPEWEDRSDTVKDLVGHLWNVNPHEDSEQMDKSILFVFVSADLSDVGGGPKAAIHSYRRSQPLFLLPVYCSWGATVQSI